MEQVSREEFQNGPYAIDLVFHRDAWDDVKHVTNKTWYRILEPELGNHPLFTGTTSWDPAEFARLNPEESSCSAMQQALTRTPGTESIVRRINSVKFLFADLLCVGARWNSQRLGRSTDINNKLPGLLLTRKHRR